MDKECIIVSEDFTCDARLQLSTVRPRSLKVKLSPTTADKHCGGLDALVCDIKPEAAVRVNTA